MLFSYLGCLLALASVDCLLCWFCWVCTSRFVGVCVLCVWLVCFRVWICLCCGGFGCLCSLVIWVVCGFYGFLCYVWV